jgi:cell shape-determining protein MreD
MGFNLMGFTWDLIYWDFMGFNLMGFNWISWDLI